jgi:hypothetical protein
MRANMIYLFPWTLRGIVEGSWLRPKERGRLTPQQASDPPIPPPAPGKDRDAPARDLPNPIVRVIAV